MYTALFNFRYLNHVKDEVSRQECGLRYTRRTRTRNVSNAKTG